MKVTFNTEELQKVLSQLATVVSKKATSQVYEHVRLFASDNGDRTFSIGMIGVDVDASLTRYFLKATADGPVDVLLPHGKLQEIVSKITVESTTIEVEGETKAVLRAAKLRVALPAYPTEQWPPMIERPETVKATLGLPGFKEQIAACDFAFPKEENKFVAAVARVESTGEMLKLVVTDGFRIAIAHSKQNAGEFSLTVSETALAKVKKLEGTKLAVLETDAGFYFETTVEENGTTHYLEALTVTRVAGEFPNYSNVLPKAHVSEIVIEKGAFQEALACVMPMSDGETNTITFSAAENGASLVMAAKSQAVDQSNVGNAGMFINTADNEIDARATGPAVAFQLNGKFLEQFLSQATGPLVVRIGAAGAKAPIVDFHANGDNYRYLQMQAV